VGVDSDCSYQPVTAANLKESVFLRACRREPTPYTPIWLMRQAGRYMPEYRAVRARLSFLELCHDSEQAAEVTVTAARILGVDAAIIFADILLILEPLDVGLEFTKGDGPAIRAPLRSPQGLDALRPYDTADRLSFVYEAIRLTCRELGDIPLIGFAGAPFTLGSYLIEGGGSRNYVATKRFMYAHEEAWHRLMGMLAELINSYLHAQVDAGAAAIQLFDSWVGCLSPSDYAHFAAPHTATALRGVSERAPVIHFGTSTSGMLDEIRAAGGDVVGADWRIPLDRAWQAIGHDRGIQGNLDPVTLFAPRQTIARAAEDILRRAAGRPGHVFNLGHGILPETPVDHVKFLVDHVHQVSSR
jgi:uroporphyrinogen decarboxylase